MDLDRDVILSEEQLELVAGGLQLGPLLGSLGAAVDTLVGQVLGLVPAVPNPPPTGASATVGAQVSLLGIKLGASANASA